MIVAPTSDAGITAEIADRGTLPELQARPKAPAKSRIRRTRSASTTVPSVHNVDRALGQALALILAAAAWRDAGAQQVENSLREELRSCAVLANDSERLACYDRMTERLFSSDPVESRPSSPEEMFGARRRPPQGSRANGEVAPEPLSQITAHVAILREGKDGSILIELDNGQVWRQSGTGDLLLRVGDKVTISRAALGTFRLLTPTGRFSQVRRVR